MGPDLVDEQPPVQHRMWDAARDLRRSCPAVYAAISVTALADPFIEIANSAIVPLERRLAQQAERLHQYEAVMEKRRSRLVEQADSIESLQLKIRELLARTAMLGAENAELVRAADEAEQEAVDEARRNAGRAPLPQDLRHRLDDRLRPEMLSDSLLEAVIDGAAEVLASYLPPDRPAAPAVRPIRMSDAREGDQVTRTGIVDSTDRDGAVYVRWDDEDLILDGFSGDHAGVTFTRPVLAVPELDSAVIRCRLKGHPVTPYIAERFEGVWLCAGMKDEYSAADIDEVLTILDAGRES